eukprot:m.8738 g.8738  ORF g.8738 m.8738 type:complete len:325 (-) comp6711_c0_seq1:119-1093(-)
MAVLLHTWHGMVQLFTGESGVAPWPSKPMTLDEVPADFWTTSIAILLTSFTIQYFRWPQLREKAAALVIKSKSARIGADDAYEAPAPIRALFSFYWVFYTISNATVIPLTYGWAGMMLGLSMIELLLAFDLVVTEHMAVNLAILECNGYGFWQMMLMIRFTTVMAFVGHYNTVISHCGGVIPVFDVYTLVTVVGILAVTEGLFYPCHKALHRIPALSKYHVAHHCCKLGGFHQAVTLHPIDMFFEFTLPKIAVLVICVNVMGNPWLLLVTTWIVGAWYALEHDDLLGLPHTKHHKYINQVYTIYLDHRESNPEKDTCKPLVKDF